MLQWFYDQFGLLGSIMVAALFFALFVFWISGIAGINTSRTTEHRRNLLVTIAVLFPPYPILWLVKEIVRQYMVLKQED